MSKNHYPHFYCSNLFNLSQVKFVKINLHLLHVMATSNNKLINYDFSMYVNEKKELWLFFAAWYSPLEFVSVISRWKSRLDI